MLLLHPGTYTDTLTHNVDFDTPTPTSCLSLKQQVVPLPVGGATGCLVAVYFAAVLHLGPSTAETTDLMLLSGGGFSLTSYTVLQSSSTHVTLAN